MVDVDTKRTIGMSIASLIGAGVLGGFTAYALAGHDQAPKQTRIVHDVAATDSPTPDGSPSPSDSPTAAPSTATRAPAPADTTTAPAPASSTGGDQAPQLPTMPTGPVLTPGPWPGMGPGTGTGRGSGSGNE